LMVDGKKIKIYIELSELLHLYDANTKSFCIVR
jgi:hypothetical protein